MQTTTKSKTQKLEDELKKKIRNYVLKNHKSMTTSEMALKLNVDNIKVGACYANLKRNKIINCDIKKEVSIIDKMASVYELAKKTNANTYTNHNGENKEKARNKMANYVIGSGIIGIVPTLPNTEWVIEQKIDSKLRGVEFLGVECNEPTFNIMKTNLRTTKLKAKTHFGFIGELMYGKLENTYAHLILDYCGMLPTMSKEIEYAINNDIIKIGGFMAITFAKPIRGTDIQSEKIKSLSAINNTDDRCVSDKGVEAYFNKVTGWNYQVVEFFYYQDTYPMTLVMIKRIK